MIGTSLLEYMFIRVCILFLHSIAPASVLFTAWLLLRPFLPQSLQCDRLPFPIEAWLVAEAVFFLGVFLPLRYSLQRSAIYHEPMSDEQRERLFRYCMSNVGDPDRFCCRWLMVRENGHIRRENVKDFIRWAFFSPEQVQEYEPEVEAYMRHMEKMLGRELPSGKTDAEGLGPMLHEVDALHRSLLWYTVGCLVCVAGVDNRRC